eukprot:scaffold18507_cov188-Amphora_coffeaeformis.AAC.3
MTHVVDNVLNNSGQKNSKMAQVTCCQKSSAAFRIPLLFLPRAGFVYMFDPADATPTQLLPPRRLWGTRNPGEQRRWE